MVYVRTNLEHHAGTVGADNVRVGGYRHTWCTVGKPKVEMIQRSGADADTYVRRRLKHWWRDVYDGEAVRSASGGKAERAHSCARHLAEASE